MRARAGSGPVAECASGGCRVRVTVRTAEARHKRAGWPAGVATPGRRREAPRGHRVRAAWAAGHRGRRRGLAGSPSNLPLTGITLYSHPYGGAFLNEDKM